MILILTDEERYVPSYDDPSWYSTMTTKQFLEANSIKYTRHYTSSTACTPSRACLFTGLPVTTHGCTQTPGFYKQDDDPNMVWLSPRFKTMGHHFRSMGYSTYYVGKWHLTEHATPQEVDKYGFSGWFGPEPHGPDYNKSGIPNDPIYIQEAIKLLENHPSNIPFLLVLSVVNPHDIVLYTKYKFYGMKLPPTSKPSTVTFPDHPFEPMASEPTSHQQYRSLYSKSQLPEAFHLSYHKSNQEYRNFYHHLLQHVDNELWIFMNWFLKSKYANTTYLIYTSDHGDMLGTKGLYQKWYSAYDEAIRIPLYIYHASLLSSRIVDFVTSSIDILPTMLSLAGASTTVNITDHICLSKVVLFETYDDVFNGNSPYPIYIQRFPVLMLFMKRNESMKASSGKHVKAFIGYYNGNLWKYIMYHTYGSIIYEQLFNLTTDPEERLNRCVESKNVVMYLTSQGSKIASKL